MPTFGPDHSTKPSQGTALELWLLVQLIASPVENKGGEGGAGCDEPGDGGGVELEAGAAHTRGTKRRGVRGTASNVRGIKRPHLQLSSLHTPLYLRLLSDFPLPVPLLDVLVLLHIHRTPAPVSIFGGGRLRMRGECE